jgi:holo-[acyl-carrier protein] synthase
METILHGIDLVDCSRIKQMLGRHRQNFLDRVFTEGEQLYAKKGRNRIEKLAGRFAVKEAVLKTIGTGWRGKIKWTDIEVKNNVAGQPEVKLTGEVARIAKKAGIKQLSVSITHISNFAIASAVALAKSK